MLIDYGGEFIKINKKKSLLLTAILTFAFLFTSISIDIHKGIKGDIAYAAKSGSFKSSSGSRSSGSKSSGSSSGSFSSSKKSSGSSSGTKSGSFSNSKPKTDDKNKSSSNSGNSSNNNKGSTYSSGGGSWFKSFIFWNTAPRFFGGSNHSILGGGSIFGSFIKMFIAIAVIVLIIYIIKSKKFKS